MNYGMLKILSQMNAKSTLNKIEQIAHKTGNSFLHTFTDIVWCALIYGAGPYDYELFELYSKSAEQRKTFVTRGKNNSFVKKYNDPKYFDLFDNKAKLDHTFSAFLKRNWCSTENLTAEKLEEMRKSSSRLIYKPLFGTCGIGVEMIDVADQCTDIVLTQLKKKEPGVIEEYVAQSSEMNVLFPNAVNTVRVITFLKDEECIPIGAFLRIGTENNCVDNLNHGGIAAKITLNTGEIDYPGANKNGDSFVYHPNTKTSIVGFKIPKWDEVIDLCKVAAKVIPQIRYVGWDIAICDDEVKMIEANCYPGHDILQLPAYTPGGIGMKEDFQALY